jgi:hypothetical protein
MEFRLADLKGKKIYAANKVGLYRKSTDTKPFTYISKGNLIGVLDGYKIDTTGVNPRDLKSIKNAKIWFMFKDFNGKFFGFKFIPKANQIDLKKIKDQGVKSEEQYSSENKAAYEKSPLTAAAETVSEASSDFLKKYAPLIAAGLITVILITRK